jgi:DNA-binding transcriptional LysR family regulator
MDVRQLRHFVAVAETLHFGKAADRIGMTQPPLSQSIRALEDDLGAPLFMRTKRSVALTPFGAQWLPHVREALSGIDALAGTAAVSAGAMPAGSTFPLSAPPITGSCRRWFSVSGRFIPMSSLH